jgi:TolA-binding protein
MATPEDRGGAAARRAGLLDRVVQLGRRRRAADAGTQELPDDHQRRIQTLEERINQLEALVEGLQDAIHRESTRESQRINALEKKSEPAEISRALSRDARERGI